MAHVKKGHLRRSPLWGKHLKSWKKVFWKSHRQEEKALTRKETKTC